VVKTILYKRTIALGTSIDFRKDSIVGEVINRTGLAKTVDISKQPSCRKRMGACR